MPTLSGPKSDGLASNQGFKRYSQRHNDPNDPLTQLELFGYVCLNNEAKCYGEAGTLQVLDFM